MESSSPSFFSLIKLIYSTTLCYLLFQANQLQLIVAHKLVHRLHPGPLITITKHLSFPNFNGEDIKILGSATISKNNNAIQIPDASLPTVDLTYKAGRAIYSSPIRLFDPLTLTPPSFNTTFSFQFNTTGGSSNGGGFAFVFVPDELTIGRSGPWLGMYNDACDNYYKAFAVEFDASYDPEFGDPNGDHVGINLGKVVSFKTAQASEVGVSFHDGLVHRAWIVYDGHRKWIDVYLGLDDGAIPTKPLLSARLDLSHFLKEYMFVGFSASTGNSPQIHNILSWNFSSTTRANLRVPTTNTCHRNVAHQVSKYSATHRRQQFSSFSIFLFVVGLCTLAWVTLYCSSSNQSANSVAAVVGSFKKQKPVPPSKPRPFTIHEIHRATRGFSKEEVLMCSDNSRGGVVYRGTLPNERRVSVKRFSIRISNEYSSWLERRRAVRGVIELARVSHPSLAIIRGWCFDCREEVIVICDYFQNGSLDKWLFGLGVLSWTRRFKLIKDVAEALSYLHSKGLVHGNLKTSSVFLDISCQAVLGDYGFAHYQVGSSGRVDSVVAGQKYDVFEFGLLVLEIVAGRRRSVEDQGGRSSEGLLGFAWGMHERGEMMEVVDKKVLVGSYVDSEQVVRVLQIGLSCTLNDRPQRPSMEEVVELFNMQKPIPKLPLSQLGVEKMLDITQPSEPSIPELCVKSPNSAI